MTEDLITRLTAAIDAFEAGSGAKDDPSGHCDDLNGRHLDHADVLRWCAADRKILALHQPIETFAGSTEFRPKHAGTPEFPIKVICELCADHDRENGWDDHDEDVQYPCPTLRAVAGRYGLEDTRG